MRDPPPPPHPFSTKSIISLRSCEMSLNFSVLQAATITDEDIDAIIQKGVQSTEELNAKMKDFTDNAMKFTMDGGIAYEYKDGEEEETDNVDYKSLAGRDRSPLPPTHTGKFTVTAVLATSVLVERCGGFMTSVGWVLYVVWERGKGEGGVCGISIAVHMPGLRMVG